MYRYTYFYAKEYCNNLLDCILYVLHLMKTSMNVMVIMGVIITVLTLMDLLCVHVMMVIYYKMMEGLVKV